VLLDVEEGSFQVRGVELITNAESKWTELSALPHDGVHEAKSEDQCTPLLIGLDFLKEVLVDSGRESTGNTSLKTLWWLGGNLDCHLQETQWEFFALLASDPKTEVLVNNNVLRVKDLFHLCHELKRQVAVVEHQPLTITETTVNDGVLGRLLLLLSHGDLVGWELLLLLGKLIDGVSWIGTSRKQEEDWSVWKRLLPSVNNLISHWLSEVITKNLPDELIASKNSSVLTNGSDQAQVEEVTDVLVSSNLILKVWDNGVLWLVLIKELAPVLLKTSNTLWQLLVEEGVVVTELVLGKGNNVEPDLLVHPVVLLVTVINTRTGLQEHTHISISED
jgi:hypothetical protein